MNGTDRLSRWIRHPALWVSVLGAGTLLTILLMQRQTAHELSVRAPVPGDAPAATRLNELSPSTFTVPVEVALAPLIQVVEEALPRAFGDMEDRKAIDGRDDLEAAFQAERGPISASFSDSTAVLATTLSYSARAWYDPPILPEVSASCGTGEGEPRPRLAITLSTPLTIDRNWRLISQISARQIAPASEERRDRCTVTILEFDMTDEVVGAAHDLMRERGPTADSAVAALDIRAQFQEWWDLIANPIRLADDVWLMLGPEAVGRSAIRGDGQSIHTSLTLSARPRVVISSGRPETEAAPIPALEAIEGGEGLRIFADAEADYGELATLLRDQLGSRQFSAGSRTLEIRSVRISGVGDGRIAVALGVGGDVAGDLYLVGTPVYDALTGRVGVPDLDFDVGTREALVAGAAWVARLGLVDLFREEAHWPAAPAIDWARTQVETGFNTRISDQVRLEGAVDTVSVLGVSAGRESLRIRAEVRGRAQMIVSTGEG